MQKDPRVSTSNTREILTKETNYKRIEHLKVITKIIILYTNLQCLFGSEVSKDTL